MSVKPEKIQVQIKYKGVEQQFVADPQEAWLLVDSFFKKLIPSFEIAQKLWLNVDFAQLATDLSGIVAFSGDGVSLLVPKNKLTDNETLLVWFAGYYLGYKLGLVNCDSLSKEELQTKLEKSSKITSTRLGEFVKSDFAAKTADERFRVTTFGIVQFQKEVLPKIKTKMSAKI